MIRLGYTTWSSDLVTDSRTYLLNPVLYFSYTEFLLLVYVKPFD